MIALELMIGGSYPSSGNGVTLAKFLESSSASFEAIDQLLDYHSVLYIQESPQRKVLPPGVLVIGG